MMFIRLKYLPPNTSRYTQKLFSSNWMCEVHNIINLKLKNPMFAKFQTKTKMGMNLLFLYIWKEKMCNKCLKIY